MRAVIMILLAGLLLYDTPALAQDQRWPHQVTAPGGATVTVYQPQAISWPDQKTLTARMALAITPVNTKTPILGTVQLSFATATDKASGLVTLSDPKLDSSQFPAVSTDQASQLEQRIRAALPTLQLKAVPLNSLLLSLKGAAAAARPVAVYNDPPAILYAERPSSLVVFDGEPVLAPAGNSGLKFAVNTNWEVFFDPAGQGTWYLLNNGAWFAAPAATGPYKPTNKLPPALSRLPNDASFAEVRKAIPPRPINAAQAPTIYVSTKPAEIIVTDGPPALAPVAGTGLQYVKNAAGDVFFDKSTSKYYYLTSGRWFSAGSLNGPWTYATDSLPADFALIPSNDAQQNVLASVPGTAQAQLAVLHAQVPQQASLKRSEAKVSVSYGGNPEFKPIPGTDLSYAVNTSFEVIRAAGKYYVCYQGAWFVGATPTGPWALADSVPQQIYSIPPSSPVYNTTYVTVYGSTAESVTYGYTAGYTMGFVSAGVLVYGTGYYYPPYFVPGPTPIYYPYPDSYAGGVWYNSASGAWAQGGAIYGPYGGVAKGGTYYNPTNGAWARGGAIYGPYGGAGAVSYYNPTTGAYAHGSASWGPNGGTAHGDYYNPRTGISANTNQNWNAYSRWGSSTISGPNKTVNTASASNARRSVGGFSSSTGAEGAGYRGVNGNKGGAVKTQNGDVYAGRDGNVYQHDSDGWSKWNNGGWNPVNPPKSGGGNRQSLDSDSWGQLEQDRQARYGGGGYGGRYDSGYGGGRYGGGYGGGRYGGGGGFRR
jgi:hypothetical protein